jgi:hypothetical protein
MTVILTFAAIPPSGHSGIPDLKRHSNTKPLQKSVENANVGANASAR